MPRMFGASARSEDRSANKVDLRDVGGLRLIGVMTQARVAITISDAKPAVWRESPRIRALEEIEREIANAEVEIAQQRELLALASHLNRLRREVWEERLADIPKEDWRSYIDAVTRLTLYRVEAIELELEVNSLQGKSLLDPHVVGLSPTMETAESTDEKG